MAILQEHTPATTESNWQVWQSVTSRAPLVCCLASVVPLVMFATVVILRGGFSTPMAPLCRLTGVSLLVLNVAALGSRKHWILCGPMLSMLCLALVTAMGLSPIGGFTWISTLFAVVGALLCVRNWMIATARVGLLRMVGLTLLGLFLGVYSESVYWGNGSVHDITYSEGIIAGRVRPDVAEQAAVVNMIATYGVASTAVDGLVPLRYHNGSLWIAEGLRRICGFRAVDFLAYGYGILLIPLYIAAFFGSANLVSAAVRGERDTPSLNFWLAAMVTFVGIFPFMDDALHLNFNGVIIDSDSFLLAITLSLLFVGVGVCYYESQRARSFVAPQWENIALGVLLVAALGLAGWVKISQIYLLLALAVYLCWRVKWLRTWPFLIGTGCSVALFAAMYYGEIGANQSNFALFNFDRTSPEWIPYFFVGHFFWVWLLFILWCRFRGVDTSGQLWRAVKAGQSILFEMALITAVVGIIPYLLINFNSPAWKYFTEFQGVVSSVFVIAFVPEFQWRDVLRRARGGSLLVTTALLLGLAVTVSGHLFMTTVGATYRMIKRGCETRAVMAGGSDTAWRQQLRQIKARRSVVAASMAKRIRVTECLDRLGEQPAEQRRGTALYIPKINRTYWDMRQLGDGATPFLAPALAGMPMVDGLPEFEDIGWARVGWGYPQYKLLDAPEVPTENVDGAIMKARKDGFRKLLIMREAEAEGCGYQEIPLS